MAPCYNKTRKGASVVTDTPLTRPFKTVGIKFLIVLYYQHNGDDQRNQR